MRIFLALAILGVLFLLEALPLWRAARAQRLVDAMRALSPVMVEFRVSTEAFASAMWKAAVAFNAAARIINELELAGKAPR